MTTVDSERPPLFRPPELRTKETRAPSRLELFFDLAYVLAVSELATSLLVDLEPDGVLKFLALFTLVWLSWVQFTLYNNRFDTDDLVLRFAKLGAMAAVLGVAASMGDATSSKVVPFTVCYAVGRLVIAGLYYRAWRHVDAARGTTSVYLVAMTAVAALWFASLAVPPPAAFLLWGAAGLVDVTAPIVAGQRPGRAPLHLEHLPERFALLVILVLGEVIGAVVTGVHQVKWSGVSVAIGASGFVVAAALWWAHFDVGGTVSARGIQRADAEESGRSPRDEEPTGQHQDDTTDGTETLPDETLPDDTLPDDTQPDDTQPSGPAEPVDERHDLFIYGHLPVTAGILAVAVGVEGLVLHPDRPLPSGPGFLVTAGIIAFFLGATMLLRGGEQRSRLSLGWPLGAAGVVLVWGVLGPHDPLIFSIGVALITAGAAAVGAVISRRTPGKSHRPTARARSGG